MSSPRTHSVTGIVLFVRDPAVVTTSFLLLWDSTNEGTQPGYINGAVRYTV